MYVFNAYNNCRHLLKVIHFTLDSQRPHRDSEVWKQDSGDVLEGSMAEIRAGSEAQEALHQMDKITRQGVTTENGEPKTSRAVNPWLEYILVTERSTRYEDLPFQHVHNTSVELARYGLGDAHKGGFRSGFTIPRRGEDGNSERIGGLYARHGVWCKQHQHKFSNNRELINIVEAVEEEVDSIRMDKQNPSSLQTIQWQRPYIIGKTSVKTRSLN